MVNPLSEFILRSHWLICRVADVHLQSGYTLEPQDAWAIWNTRVGDRQRQTENSEPGTPEVR